MRPTVTNKEVFMEQEQGCGWGCGLVVLLGGVVLLCVFLPFIGLPVGLLLAVGAVIAAMIRRKQRDDS